VWVGICTFFQSLFSLKTFLVWLWKTFGWDLRSHRSLASYDNDETLTHWNQSFLAPKEIKFYQHLTPVAMIFFIQFTGGPRYSLLCFSLFWLFAENNSEGNLYISPKRAGNLTTNLLNFALSVIIWHSLLWKASNFFRHKNCRQNIGGIDPCLVYFCLCVGRWGREKERRHLPVVNFTNVLRATFVQADPISAKDTLWLDGLFALLGSVHMKTFHNHFGEIDPCLLTMF